MENNINMNYKDLISILFFSILVGIPTLFFILNRSTHLIITANIDNNNTEVKVSFRCFFNLISIIKTIYPISKSKENKKNKESKSKFKKVELNMIELENLLVLYRIITKIKRSEIYSDLSYGSENIHFTSFIYVLVNALYGNISNYFNSEKMYLKVTPCYTQNFIKYKGIVHIRPNIKEAVILFKGIFKIYIDIKAYKKVKYNKESGMDEIGKFDKKYNGYNS
ncbi:hypothetical protein GCM10008904_04050 [Paraclostridium ghonii]|uniref:DUF2953 domain-containing protein n=1 Tax=Paraclostridium ghonii TaxID=29358 RepID=A0ABU0N0J7_9FIRM|nr:DUF2953 domain-containing protein [Paeniclostridium ghonii]MDQ0556693.1 hypothetical protein [Paeniclostridium ghonii]